MTGSASGTGKTPVPLQSTFTKEIQVAGWGSCNVLLWHPLRLLGELSVNLVSPPPPLPNTGAELVFCFPRPEYVSMSAGEAQNPRAVMPRAFNAVFYRLTAFFVLGSLAVGILVPYNDAEMSAAFQANAPGAAASPYVVAMNRLQIRVLPDMYVPPPPPALEFNNTHRIPPSPC